MGELDKKAPAENLIKSVEQTYFDLRKRYPDQDEHWFLANAWLERYGSGEEAKQKGAEWARFTAYKDTCEFSILEPPESIRGLELFLVFRELGEQQAKYYENEFFQMMEPVLKSKKSNVFFDEYKQKNPLTWKENQAVDNSSYSLYWFFRGLELEQEQEERVEDVWGERDIIDIITESEEEELGES